MSENRAARRWPIAVIRVLAMVVLVQVLTQAARGRYMLHCHNLEHEDMAMMANFDVV